METQGERIATGCLTAVLWLVVPGLMAAVLAASLLFFIFGNSSPVPVVSATIIWLGGAAIVYWLASTETTGSSMYGPSVSNTLMREALSYLPLRDAIQMSRRDGAVQGGVRVQKLHSGYSVSQFPYLFLDDYHDLVAAEDAARQRIADYDPYGWKSM